jgi:hypothetical protein
VLLLAIDPGPERSAWMTFSHGRPIDFGIDGNESVLYMLKVTKATDLAIEWIASYGMAVGETTFTTCIWNGRFYQRWADTHAGPIHTVYRRDARKHVCHNGNATDANIRQALIDRYGPSRRQALGLKAAPGPLYGMRSHLWSALAVAVTVADQNEDA